uniref:Uncharacterized protein n=1 Tax=Leersia perrieri TaxID=77586 RepID=A0A0D9WEZ7_9ORYZ
MPMRSWMTYTPRRMHAFVSSSDATRAVPVELWKALHLQRARARDEWLVKPHREPPSEAHKARHERRRKRKPSVAETRATSSPPTAQRGPNVRGKQRVTAKRHRTPRVQVARGPNGAPYTTPPVTTSPSAYREKEWENKGNEGRREGKAPADPTENRREEAHGKAPAEDDDNNLLGCQSSEH